ncbi:MAG: lyase family protein [Caldilineaceae bacterium]
MLKLAQQHLHTLMPGYTHTQPAQPVTFAHYLAGVLTFLAKDQPRIAAAYANVNESPPGAAAFTGTGFPIDRQRGPNCWVSMASSKAPITVLAPATI